jgi:hypothetical protein
MTHLTDFEHSKFNDIQNFESYRLLKYSKIKILTVFEYPAN